MSLPATTLRGDLTGTAFGAAPTWTDYTAYLETGGDASPIGITWGKQDEDTAPQARRCSFVLDNTDGRFTTGGSIITTAHQFNVRVTVGGTTYDRFTGYVEDVEVLFPGQAYSQVRVTCVDISGRLTEALPLKSMVEYEMLADTPWFLYNLGENDPSSSAGDISSSAFSPAVVTAGKYGGNQATFGSNLAGMLDALTGVAFGAYASGGTAKVTSVKFADAAAGYIRPTFPHTTEAWVVTPTAAPAGNAYVVLVAPADTDTATLGYAALYIDSSGRPVYKLVSTSGAQILTATGPASICDGQKHHLVGVEDSTNQTVTLYVDGVAVATQTAATTWVGNSRQGFIGGVTRTVPDAIGGTTYGQFPGTVALVAGYRTDIGASRVLAHYQAGVGTGPQERSDQRFTRLLSYASLTTSGLPTGQATMGGQKTSGTSLLDALKKVADTEGTDCFVTGDGKLTFQARNVRYWPTAAFTLTAADVNPDLPVRKDRLGLVNDQTATRDGGAAQRVQNAASITSYGRRDGGTLDVAPSTDFDALSNASWRVTTGKDPQTRLSEVAVDLTSQSSTALVQSLMAATISTAFAISSMPSQTPTALTANGAGLFVEGGQETIGVDRWDIKFFTSPLAASGVSFAAGGSTPNLPNTLRADAAPSQRTKLDAGLKVPF